MKKRTKKGFISEFNKFLTHSNVIDLAVGVITGAALKDLVNSLVDNIFNPILGFIIGRVDFSEFSFSVYGVKIKYGAFISSLINFILMAFVVFLIIKFINKMKTVRIPLINDCDEEVAPTTRICPFCMSEIDIKAVRCPHCTSELEKLTKD